MMKSQLSSLLFLAVISAAFVSHAEEPSAPPVEGASTPPAEALAPQPETGASLPDETAAPPALEQGVPSAEPTEASATGGATPNEGAATSAASLASFPTANAVAPAELEPTEAVTPSPRQNLRIGTPFDGALRLSVDVQALWNFDDRYQLFDESTGNARIGASLGYDVLHFEPGWVVSPEVGWSRESAEGGPSSPQFTRKELMGDHFFGALRARYAWLSWFESFARLQGGVAWSRVALEASPATSDQYAGEDVAPEFQLGAGILGRTPDPKGTRPRESLSLGLTLEAGYQLAPALALKLERKDGVGSQRFGVLAADLGELSRSGPYLRFGVFARF